MVGSLGLLFGLRSRMGLGSFGPREMELIQAAGCVIEGGRARAGPEPKTRAGRGRWGGVRASGPVRSSLALLLLQRHLDRLLHVFRNIQVPLERVAFLRSEAVILELLADNDNDALRRHSSEHLFV